MYRLSVFAVSMGLVAFWGAGFVFVCTEEMKLPHLLATDLFAIRKWRTVWKFFSRLFLKLLLIPACLANLVFWFWLAICSISKSDNIDQEYLLRQALKFAPYCWIFLGMCLATAAAFCIHSYDVRRKIWNRKDLSVWFFGLSVPVAVWAHLGGIAKESHVRARFSQFESLVRECESLMATNELAVLFPPDRFRLSPEIIIVDTQFGTPTIKEDGIFRDYKIPSSLERVRTVLWIRRRAELLRTYTPSGGDYQWHFYASLVRWPEKEIVWTREFIGGSVAPSGGPATYLNSTYGTEPWDLIRAWLPKDLYKK